MSSSPWLPSWSNLHRLLARLHGAEVLASDGSETATEEFTSMYAVYAASTVQARKELQEHGKNSPQFVAADIASKRLFHRVKKMQGLKKDKVPKPS